MEKLFSIEYGVGGICVLLTLMVLLRVGEFLWSLQKKKESASEKTTEELVKAVKENTSAINRLDTSISELPKMKRDLQRFYAAIKMLAGEKWSTIRDEIMKDEL